MAHLYGFMIYISFAVLFFFLIFLQYGCPLGYMCAVKQTEREKEGECMRESESRERENHRGGFVTISFLSFGLHCSNEGLM